MHGCGNDYVFIDCFSNPAPANPQLLAVATCDRHRSIGADGLVLMLPEERPDAVARMRMFNVDGSEGSLCGNALRCMAMWLHQNGRCGTEFVISMGDRKIPATIIQSDSKHRTAIVSVMIGPPLVQNPMASGRSAFVREVSLEGVSLPPLRHPVVHVSMGNPHTIVFLDALSDIDITILGPKIEHHHHFPDRTNVEFVEVDDPRFRSEQSSGSRETVRVRVWERGCGETLACGSGACAVAVAGICNGMLTDGIPVRISMPGGELRVLWNAENFVQLEGPAKEAYRGSVSL